MYKKMLAALTAAAIITVCSACNSNGTPTETQETTAPVSTSTEVTTAAATTEPEEESQMALFSTLDDFPELSVIAQNNNFIISCGNNGLLYVFDKENLTYTQTEVENDFFYSQGIFSDGSFYILNDSGYTYYDKEGTVLGKNSNEYESFSVIGENKKLYYAVGGTIYEVSDPFVSPSESVAVTTEQLSDFTDPYACEIYPVKCGENGELVVEVDDYTASAQIQYVMISEDRTKFTFCGLPASDLYIIGGDFYGIRDGGESCVDYVTLADTALFSLSSKNESVVLMNEDIMITKSPSSDGKTIMRVYSAENGKLLGRTELSDSTYYTVKAEGSKVKLFFYENYSLKIYDWLYTSVGVKDERSELDTVFNAKERSVELKRSIENEYGVTIATGADAVQNIQDYECGLCEDDVTIFNALKALSEVLEKFPDGMLAKMIDSEVKSIDFILCGTLTSNNEYNLSVAGGVSNVENHRQIIAVDVNSSADDLKITYSHEIWHAMESYIDRLSWADWENAYFTYWDSLNPDGFNYNWVYNEYVDDTYTPNDVRADDDKNIVCFVDYYGKINNLEDKARIFEKIFTYEDELPDYFSSNTMQMKAGLMCATIRDAFKLSDDTELCWEKGVRTHDLSYYNDLLDGYYPEAVG